MEGLMLKLQYFGRLTGKDPDAGKDQRPEEKWVTEDEMVGWHHRLSGHKFEQAPGDSEGQGSLACCSSSGHKEWDTTEKLNNKNFQTDLAPRLRRPVELSRAPEASGADVEMLHNLEGLLKQSLTCPTPEFLIQ